MKTPEGDRQASPLERQMRENRDRRRRQAEERQARNAKVVDDARARGDLKPSA